MASAVLYAIFFLSIAIQFGYAAYYFLPFLSFTPPQRAGAGFPVSVIIAAHNEGENLKRHLPLVLDQQYPHFEVIVVDDRSSDDTKKNLAELRQKYSNLRIKPIERTPPGIHPKKHALTQGIAAARYEHLLFTDADCKPKSNQWIGEMAKGFFADTAIVLGYSPYIRIFGFLNSLIRYETFLSALQYLSFASKGNTYMGVGRNLAYTKTCFNQINGFGVHQDKLGGDDDLFVQEARHQYPVNVVLTRESQTVSMPKRTYREWIIQKRRHLAIGQLYGWSDKVRIGLFMGSNIFFYLALGILLGTAPEVTVVGIWWGIRCGLIYLVYWLNARKLKEEFSLFLLPVLDLVYFLNYLVIGVSVLMFNKVRWK